MECASSIWPSSSASTEDRAPCRTAGRPLPSEAAPDASTPTSRTSSSSRKPWKSPIAFQPPPAPPPPPPRQPLLDGEELLARLAADNGLQLGHELGIRRRPDARA